MTMSILFWMRSSSDSSLPSGGENTADPPKMKLALVA
jgi:hypothetical protein